MDPPQHPNDGVTKEREREKTHATTSSVSSSLFSYHTVQSSTYTPRFGCTPLRPNLFARDGEDGSEDHLHSHTDHQGESSEGCRTPTPASTTFAFDVNSPATHFSTFPTLVNDDEEGEQEKVQEREKGGGHRIKPLPNGMISLPPPSPSCHSTSFCSSPPSRRLTLLSLHPTQHEESSATTSSTRPSTTSSYTTPSHSLHKPHKVGSGVDSWASQFWTVIQDPTNPNNVFFANPTTGECKWQLPRGSIVLPPREEGEWWELWDGEREYYWHTKTKECRWERPAEAEGMVVPMREVQRLHFAPVKVGRSASDGQSVSNGNRMAARVDVEREDRKGEDLEGVFTPLRPRTKSLPKYQKHQAKESPRYKLTNTEKGRGREEAALQARKSILLRDERALAIARNTSGPPFHPEPTRRRIRPSTTGTSRTVAVGHRPEMKSVSTSHTYPFLASKSRCWGLEDEQSQKKNQGQVGEIKKVGKGLAYSPSATSSSGRNSPVRVRGKKSLPFLKGSGSGGIEGNQRKVLVGLPGDIATALVNVEHPIIAIHSPSQSSQASKTENNSKEGEEKENRDAKREGKLNKLITFVRCKASTTIDSTSTASFGNF